MWKEFLWKIRGENFLHNPLWTTVEKLTSPCGKISVAALSKNPLFHISFPYCGYYYLSYLLIYIFL